MWTTTDAATMNLSLNPVAPMTRDLESIQHQVEASEVIITLKPFRRCRTPSFRVRLSGESLYLLKLSKQEANKLVYSFPPLIDSGAYFIEVVALLCAPFDPNNFVDTCLEEVAGGSNVVTLPYAFNNTVGETAGAKRPRWVLSGKHDATILPTRYQKITCMSEELGWCPAKSTDLLQFNSYDWVDQPDYIQSLHDVMSISHADERNKLAVKAGEGMIHICVIGDSHARELSIHGNKLGLKNVNFEHISSIYPSEFNVNWLHQHRCSYAVVTYGQWPASFMTDRKPYTQTKYHDEMRRVVTLLQNYDHNQTQVFVRSVNYNGLGARQTACPPIDYRSPPVIDMYNAVLHKLSKELNVEYIDLNHVMGPMWDSALDWCHPVGKVATAEVEWVMAHMLQSSLRRNLGVVFLNHDLPNKSLIRFSNDKTVFLFQDGQMRSFPNAHTFMVMGFDFGDVQVFDASRRGEFDFGAELPSL